MFNMGKKTISATMASKAVSVLQHLIRLIESKVNIAACKSLDGRKKGSGVALLASRNQQSDNSEDEIRKRKKQKDSLNVMFSKPSSSQPLCDDLGISPQNLSRSQQQICHETGFNPNQSIRSSSSITSSAVVSLTHSNSSSAIQYPGSKPVDAFASQSTLHSVSHDHLPWNTLSNPSSSSRLSHHYRTLDQVNSSQIRPVARLPHNIDEDFVEFGSMDSNLAHHTFNFSTYQPISRGENEGQIGGMNYGEGTVGNNSTFSDVFGHDLSFQSQPTAGEENYSIRTRNQDAPGNGGLESFQPTFNF